MGHISYEEGKKAVIRGLILLGIVTIVEVMTALFAKGHIIEGYHMNKVLYAILMGIFSMIKALFILGEFMHLKYESKGLRVALALPFILILWAVIAFLHDGNRFRERRLSIPDPYPVTVPQVEHPAGDHATHATPIEPSEH